LPCAVNQQAVDRAPGVLVTTQDKLFIITTGKTITKVELRGGIAIDELVGSNKGKVRRADIESGREKIRQREKERAVVPGRTSGYSARNDNRRSKKHRG
jgi:hypothetical protein